MSSKSMNKVFLMGHLGQTPELQYSKAGKPYARLNLATNRWWSGGDEGEKELTDWHSVFVWGPLAERCAKNLQVGALVFVEGALTYWKVAQSSNNETPYKNAVHGHVVRFLNSPRSAFQPNFDRLDGSESPSDVEDLDNPEEVRNHNAVAHL